MEETQQTRRWSRQTLLDLDFAGLGTRVTCFRLGNEDQATRRSDSTNGRWWKGASLMAVHWQDRKCHVGMFLVCQSGGSTESTPYIEGMTPTCGYEVSSTLTGDVVQVRCLQKIIESLVLISIQIGASGLQQSLTFLQRRDPCLFRSLAPRDDLRFSFSAAL